MYVYDHNTMIRKQNDLKVYVFALLNLLFSVPLLILFYLFSNVLSVLRLTPGPSVSSIFFLLVSAQHGLIRITTFFNVLAVPPVAVVVMMRGSDRMDWLSMQSLPITTKVVSSNHANDEVYSTRHYVIKFVSDLWQVGGFLRFPSLIKLTTTI
jgi:hypothetical protein